MKNITKLVFLAFFLTIIGLSCSSLKENIEPKTIVPLNGKLTTGNVENFGSFSLKPETIMVVGSSGAEIGLEGMEFEQVLQSSSTVSLTASTISSHTFGELITPISPLINIHITNESNLSQTLFKITIPMKESVGNDEFMMAFYYDAATGKLEGIPTVAYQSNKLTIATTHFSSLFVTKVKLSLLPDKIYTGFKPEIDGWPYTNYGTYYAPNGICAGMSLTAMYVYANHGGNLFRKADNEQSIENPTPGFWQDDTYGIIYGHYGQYTYSKVLGVWASNVWLLGLDDAITYRCFAYSMSVTAEPQYVRLGGSTFAGGHAMVAYAVDQHQIFVYDPNYPARRDRIVNFRGTTTGKFDAYNSGDNAESISKGLSKNYDLITYASKSALISTAQLEEGYKNYQLHSLDENLYAVEDLELVLKDKNNRTIARSKKENLVCAEKEVNLSWSNSLSNITNETALFYNSKLEIIKEPLTLDENKATIIGVFNVGKKTGSSGYGWLGFKWFWVKYSKLDPNLFGTWSFSSGNDYYALTFKDDGKAIQEVAGKKYDWLWIIEDGKIKLFVEYGKPAYLTYKIEGNGLYLWSESTNDWSLPYTKTN